MHVSLKSARGEMSDRHADTARQHHLPSAVVDVAIGIFEHALAVLQVVEPLALVNIPIRVRFLSLQRCIKMIAARAARAPAPLRLARR